LKRRDELQKAGARVDDSSQIIPFALSSFYLGHIVLQLNDILFQYVVELSIHILDFDQKLVLLIEHLIHLAAQVIIQIVDCKD